ncbi:MAG: radical SAM protein, partial [Endomicrobiales bacterium]
KYCSSISKANYYWVPIDLLVLSGILSEQYDLKVLDAIIDKKSIDEAFREIVAFGPDVIISLTSTTTWKIDFSFLKDLKKAINPQIIISGGIVLTKSRFILETYPFIDACLLDFTIAEIIHYIEGSGDLYNLTYRDGNHIVEAPRKSAGYFSLMKPRHDLFPIGKYRYPISVYHPSTCVITSMGCPFQCTFCVPATIPYRKRNIVDTISELQYIQSLGIKEVVFQDSTFTADKDYTKHLCLEMIRGNITLDWLCLTRVDCVDRELLLLMKRAGCHSIEFGVETGDQSIMQRIAKGITLEDVKTAFHLCREIGIKTCAFFILGLPGQDVLSIEKTIAFALEIDPDTASFSLPMPHYGTPLGDDIIKYNDQLCEFSDTQVTKRVNDVVDDKTLLKLRNKAYRKFYFRPGYILRQLASIRNYHHFTLMSAEFVSLVRRYII